jgi:hypothetical protein
MNAFGYEENKNGSAVGFNGLIYKDTESISMRTINAIAKILESKKRALVFDKKIGILAEERAEREEKLLKMVESTLNNSRKNIEAFKSELNAIQLLK